MKDSRKGATKERRQDAVTLLNQQTALEGLLVSCLRAFGIHSQNHDTPELTGTLVRIVERFDD